MKPCHYLLIPALFIVSCDQQEVATYDECITQTMQGVSSDVAARAIVEACQNQFPSEPEEVVAAPAPAPVVVEAPAPVVVDESRLVIRHDTAYEVNSDTPFTGVSLSYHENGQVERRITIQDGKQDGLAEQYHENGQVERRRTFKDGVIVDGIEEEYYRDGTVYSRANFKDGEPLGICFEPGCTDFN